MRVELGPGREMGTGEGRKVELERAGMLVLEGPEGSGGHGGCGWRALERLELEGLQGGSWRG